MRIAFIVNRFPLLSETFILNQLTGLIDRGHEVNVIRLYAIQDQETLRVHPDVERYCLLERTSNYNYDATAVPTNYFLRVLKGLGLLIVNFHKAPLALLRSLNAFEYGEQATSLRLMYIMISLLGKQPYDIIHCQFGTLSPVGMLLRNVLFPRAKLITTFRGYDISKYVQKAGDNIYHSLFKTGDLFLSNCEYFKHRLIKLGCDSNKIVVHGSGIDCHKFVLTPRRPHLNGPVRIVTIGRLVEKKGIEYSIRAIGKLAKVRPLTRQVPFEGDPLEPPRPPLSTTLLAMDL